MTQLFSVLRRMEYFLRHSLNLPARRPAVDGFIWVGEQDLPEDMQAATELLIVVTTCERVAPCRTLLRQLKSSLQFAGELSYRLLVIEDVAAADYSPVRSELRKTWADRAHWAASTDRMGKHGYWRTYQFALTQAERCQANAVLFVQDDIHFPQESILASRELLCQLKAQRLDRPFVLNLFASEDDEPEGRWVNFERQDHGTLPVRKTQWFDLNAYIIEGAALKALGHSMVPIHADRWRGKPTLSSGVGRQLTQRLQSRAEIYQCFPPLAFHGNEESVMNPEARAGRSLNNHSLRRASSRLHGET